MPMTSSLGSELVLKFEKLDGVKTLLSILFIIRQNVDGIKMLVSIILSL